MKIVVTAFDAFGEDKINSSLKVLEKIERDIIKITIPTSFKKSSQIIEDIVKNHRPDVVLSLGQAAGRNRISIERVAINIDDARIKDNDSYKPKDKLIRKDGETAYFSNLNIRKIEENLKKENIPCYISNTAGTFVCNHLLYEALFLAKKYNFKAGFIHLPYLKEQVLDKDMSFMELTTMIKAVQNIIDTIKSG